MAAAAPAPATLEQETIDGVTVIRLAGSITSEALPKVEPRFKAATSGRGGRVVVDLHAVKAITTPAITMFLSALRRANESGGALIFTGVRGITGDIFSRCRLDAIFTIVDSVPDGVKIAKNA